VTLVDELRAKVTDFLLEVESSLGVLLEQEDTDQNNQITIDDTGPKVIQSCPRPREAADVP
jgi:hypothetical protein